MNRGRRSCPYAARDEFWRRLKAEGRRPRTWERSMAVTVEDRRCRRGRGAGRWTTQRRLGCADTGSRSPNPSTARKEPESEGKGCGGGERRRESRPIYYYFLRTSGPTPARLFSAADTALHRCGQSTAADSQPGRLRCSGASVYGVYQTEGQRGKKKKKKNDSILAILTGSLKYSCSSHDGASSALRLRLTALLRGLQ